MSPRWAEVAGHKLWFLTDHHDEAFEAWQATQRGEPPGSTTGRRCAVEPIIDVSNVRVLARYIVELTFEPGEARVIDLEPLLDGPVFEPLKGDYELFKQVRADPEAGTIVWPNGADISPRTLYWRSRDAIPQAT